MNYEDYYKYCCPECGYCADSKRYFEMRNNEDGHECEPVYIDDRDDYGLGLEDYEGND